MRCGVEEEERHVVWNERGGTSASLKDMQTVYSLRTCAIPDSAMTQCNTAHVFLNHCLETEDRAPQILKGRAATRGWRL